MRIMYLILGVLLFGKNGNVQAQKGEKQDPDNFVTVEKASGSGETGLAWRWGNVDSTFGPLPGSMHVFRTQDSLDGRKTNGNLNVVVRDGKMLALNQPSRRHMEKDSASYYVYTTRSAMGISDRRKADVAWVFTDSTQTLPYAFEDDPVVARGRDSIPALGDMGNSHWRRWKMRTVEGGPVLVHNGKVRITNEEEGLFIKGGKDIHPRSAIGYTRDGRVIVLAVQGRTPGKAAGVTLAQEARILLDLGCYEALNLDGGGSTCMLVKGKETIQPSDKTGERPVPSVFIIKRN